MPTYEQFQENRKVALDKLMHLELMAYSGLTHAEYSAIQLVANFIRLKYEEAERKHEDG